MRASFMAFLVVLGLTGIVWHPLHSTHGDAHLSGIGLGHGDLNLGDLGGLHMQAPARDSPVASQHHGVTEACVEPRTSPCRLYVFLFTHVWSRHPHAVPHGTHTVLRITLYAIDSDSSEDMGKLDMHACALGPRMNERRDREIHEKKTTKTGKTSTPPPNSNPERETAVSQPLI